MLTLTTRTHLLWGDSVPVFPPHFPSPPQACLSQACLSQQRRVAIVLDRPPALSASVASHGVFYHKVREVVARMVIAMEGFIVDFPKKIDDRDARGMRWNHQEFPNVRCRDLIILQESEEAVSAGEVEYDDTHRCRCSTTFSEWPPDPRTSLHLPTEVKDAPSSSSHPLD